MLCMNSACQARVVMIRTLSWYFGSQPAKPTTTRMVTGLHHTSRLLPGSSTMRLSLGLRPAFSPDIAMTAPVDEITVPASSRSPYSTSRAGVAL